MARWSGPGSAFTILFDDHGEGHGRSLPPEAQAFYGDWRLPQPAGRPFVYANFVISHDGRASFSLSGAVGGAAVSGHNRHDQWLMGVLRARADAVMVGANTLRLEPEHSWTAEAIYPAEAEAFAALRRDEGRAATPLHVFVSHDGDIAAGAAVFARPEIQVVIATTTLGAKRALEALAHRPQVEYLGFGDEAVDLHALLGILYARYGVRSVLCEGGPTLYGSLLAAGRVDEEFLTISPLIIGNNRDETMRPGLIEGVAFTPIEAPRARLASARRAGDYLFLRSRYGRG
jgi:riboflavin biosynthesis pyrimidine reductase